MGMLLGGMGLYRWHDGWRKEPCPLAHADLLAVDQRQIAAVDNVSHALWMQGRLLPCQRDVQALCLWHGFACTLSSDTACVSITDGLDWLATTKMGVNPQDMCVHGHEAWICGGEDGCIHRLHLPDLHTLGAIPAIGMPQRIAIAGGTAWVLSLRPDEPQPAALVQLDLPSGKAMLTAAFPGIPGAIAANRFGVWAAAGEQLFHIPHEGREPDTVIEGFDDITHIAVQGKSALITADSLAALVTPDGLQVLHRGNVRQCIFC